jgi:hypothetical protein
MIDLSAMKGIHVDPKARTPVARKGGLTWNELNRSRTTPMQRPRAPAP